MPAFEKEEQWKKRVSYWTPERTTLLESIPKDYPELTEIQVVQVYQKLTHDEATEDAVHWKLKTLKIRNNPIPDALFSNHMTTGEVERVYGIKLEALRRYIKEKRFPAQKIGDGNYLIDITVADLLKDCQKSNRQIDWELFQTELKEIEPCLSY